jgi:LysM repeat protein
MESRHRSPLRILAPLALVVFAIALVLVLSSGGGGGGGGGGGASAAEKTRDLGPTATTSSKRSSKSSSSSSSSRSGKLSKSVYVVKRGDTLGGIADKTGVPVERLQELNPGIDQFSLVAGQRIKLR